MMCQGRSHSLSALPFANALVERGHDVTFFFEVQAPETLPLGNRVKQALLHLDSDQAQLVEEWKAFQDFIWNIRYDGTTLLQPYRACANSFTDALNSKADQYWAISNRTWDLIFVDGLFASSGYAMALLNRHKTPYVTFQTTEMLDNHVYSLALSRWYSTTRPMLVPFDFNVNNFFHRLQHCYESMKVFVTVHFFGQKIVQDAVSKAGVTDFSWDVLMNSATMTLSDYVDGWMFVQSVANDFLKIGAHCPTDVGQVSDSLLNAFINDEASKGTILMAFGTFAQWDFAPEALKSAFIDAFNNLSDYRIIWVFGKGKRPTGLQSHVKLVDWAPQKEILHQKSTKLFISHGGLKGFKESLCSETPMIIMPMFGEQTGNAILGNRIGFAEIVSKYTADGRLLSELIRRTLTSAKHQEIVSKTKRMFLDRITPSLDLGTFWAERIVKLSNSPIQEQRKAFFKIHGIELFAFQSFFLDIFLVLILAVVAVR